MKYWHKSRLNKVAVKLLFHCHIGNIQTKCTSNLIKSNIIYYTPWTTKLLGGILVSLRPVRLSVRLSVSRSRLPCPLCNIYSFGWILSILATNDHYLRGCVAHNDLWPWPISSRSFGLDLENRVRSVASTVLDGFFLYLAQMITIIRGWVACNFFSESENLNIWQIFEKSTVLDGFLPYVAQMITNMRGCVAYNDLWPWPISSRSFGFGLENRVRSVASTVLDGFFPYLIQMITSMRMCVACDDLWPWPISSWSFNLDFENGVRSVTFSVLNRLFPYLPQIITTIRGCVAS